MEKFHVLEHSQQAGLMANVVFVYTQAMSDD